jgi:hypothetical protein
VKTFDKTHAKKMREWNQTQWLSRSKLGDNKSLSALNYHWIKPDLPIQISAMVLTDSVLFCAGIPDLVDEVEVWMNPGDKKFREKLQAQNSALAGEHGAMLWAVSLKDGSKMEEYRLDAPPVFDGMIAVDGKLLLALQDGSIVSYE